MGGREEHLEGGAAAGLAINLDGAPVAADDAEHGGQTETAAGEFGREERVKNPFQCLRRHATTGVGHFEKNIDAFGQVLLEPGFGQIGVVALHHATGE